MHYYWKDRSLRWTFYIEWQHKFHVKFIIFLPEFVLFKILRKSGSGRQAGRDVNWRKRKLCFAYRVTGAKLQILSDIIKILIYRNREFVIYTAYKYICILLRDLCTKQYFKIRNYKILPRSENLTDKFKKNEMYIEIQLFIWALKQALIIVIALYMYRREQ
jgi:hypothetical protein